MAAFVQLSKISLAFGDRDILKDLHLNLSHKSRIALAGANGSGKTTFMKVIAGKISPDTGERSQSKEARVGYLPQSGLSFRDKTLREEVEQAYNHIVTLEQERDEAANTLSLLKEGDKGFNDLLERHHELQEQIVASGYYEREAMIFRVLTGLGFKKDDLDKETSSFSGGWQMRIALARILLEMPDILLLDEPTNYLDIEARDWLEVFLNSFPGGILLVSHDRFFLDQVTKETAELFQGSLKIYKGSYSAYEAKREEEIKQLQELYKQQQEEIAKIEDFIRRFRAQATKAKQVQSRIKMLEKIEKIVLPPSMNKIHFRFPPPPHSGKKVLTLDNINKSYGNRPILKDLSLLVEKGDRLNLSGVNGAGKSTLMRIIAGVDQDFTGSLTLGTDVKIAYFSQDQEIILDPYKTALEILEEDAPTELIPKLRSMLGAFLFSDDDIFKKCSVLSGGEKNRLALLKLLLRPANLLIMDEPTNHLDLNSKDVLLEALKQYEGTLIFVSHDRYFIENLATKVLEVRHLETQLYDGDYNYYRWKKEQQEENLDQPVSLVSQPLLKEKSANQLSREEEKKLKTQKRRLERQEQEILDKIEALDNELKENQMKLGTPEIYSDPTKAKEISNKIDSIEQSQIDLTEKWEQVSEELHSL